MSTSGCRLRGFVLRDLTIDLTYRLSFAIAAIDVIFGVGAHYLLSTIIGIRPGGYDPFAFILTGLVLNGAMTTAMACYSQSIRESQQTGTLPLLVASPLPTTRLVVLSSAYPLGRAALEGFLFLAAGLAIGLPLAGTNVAGAAFVFVLAMAGFSAVGILSAACIVVWKRGDPIPWLVGAASWLLGGVFFPIDRLPDWLAAFSRLLPITHALEALRPALLANTDLLTVLRRAAPLAAFTAVAVPLSLLAFHRALERARREGTLRQY